MSEVRVAVLLPHENKFVSPGLGDPRLFRHENPENNPSGTIAEQIVREPSLGLPPMSVLHHLGVIDDVAGYSFRPVTGCEINLRDFTVRKFDIERMLEEGDAMDPTDLALLSIAHNLARRWTGSIPTVR